MTEQVQGTLKVKTGFAEMMKGGVIMDVVNPEQAKIAEDAGAVAVMALERVPADIRAHGGVARMSDPTMIEGIVEAVSIPVMAKCRIGHFVEAQVLQSLGVDFIDESEVLTPADDEYHVNKWDFDVPFVCGARNLGEALRRIAEGAAMIRTKGEPGTGNVVEAVRHMRTVTTDIARIKGLRDEQLFTAAKDLQAPYELVKWVAEHGCLPVVNFSAGGIATPADAALMMQLGCDGVFVGSGIFKSGDPAKRARAIVKLAEESAEECRALAEASSSIMVGTLDYAPFEELLTRALHAFRQEHPGRCLEMLMASGAYANMEAVASGKADLSIFVRVRRRDGGKGVVPDGLPAGVGAFLFGEGECHFWMNRSCPLFEHDHVTAADLDGFTMLLGNSANMERAGRVLVEWFAGAGVAVEPDNQPCSNYLDLYLSAAGETFGIALGGVHSGLRASSDIKIFAVDDFTVPCDLYVIYNEERIGENGQLFVDCLKESISSLE